MLQIVRKERAVGAMPQVPTVYEVLEEMAITVRCWPHLSGFWLHSELTIEPFQISHDLADVAITVSYLPDICSVMPCILKTWLHLLACLMS